jgi:hypothetical protein
LRLLSKKIPGPELFVNRLLLDNRPVVLTVIGLLIIVLLLMIIVLILIKRGLLSVGLIVTIWLWKGVGVAVFEKLLEPIVVLIVV